MANMFEQAMKLSLDVMVSGARTVARSMEDMQFNQQRPETADDPAAGEGPEAAFNDAYRLAVAPLLGMIKLPLDVLTSSMKTITQAVEEGRVQTAPDAVAAATDDPPDTVPFSAEEAAQEQAALLAPEVEETAAATLWQIGRPGRVEADSPWTAVFDHRLGDDIDPINRPSIPYLLTVEDGPRAAGGTEKLRIHFTLDRDYPAKALALVYDRWGAETDQVRIDGQLLAPVQGAGTGKYRHVALALKAAARGDHVLQITTSGQTAAGGHRIDFLKMLTFTTPAGRG